MSYSVRPHRYGSPPGSAIPGILQAWTLEWGAISFSNAWKWKVKVKLLSRVWHLVTPWTAPHQAPPSMGFPRQEYRGGLPLPSPFSYDRPQLIVIGPTLFVISHSLFIKQVVSPNYYFLGLYIKKKKKSRNVTALSQTYWLSEVWGLTPTTENKCLWLLENVNWMFKSPHSTS